MASIRLKVAEAEARDVGRGVVRVDRDDMPRLGLQSGDVVRVRGKRETVAKALPAYAEQRGKSLVRMDGIVRENADATIDEWVEVERLTAPDARAVVLAPMGAPQREHGESERRHVANVLLGMAVQPDDKVRATFLGGVYREFTVVETRPKGAVVVTTATDLKVRGESVERAEQHEGAGVTYEDIGGLRKEIQRIREMIELPLRYPELFLRLGIEPPRGVLLYGPPGTGKTLIAKAVANETSAHFASIGGPEIIGKFYGESEERLRAVFEEAAARAPAIIFIDEIDAIAPKREEVGAFQQVERRVVAQLLSLMDGLQARGQVVVIGATNVPNTLDPALRRPGRLDRELTIGVPDRNGRLEVLEVHTRGMPLADDVDLERLAELTHGFVGADLAALCREAAMVTLRELMPRIRGEAEFLPDDLLADLEVREEHFLDALKEVEPSAIREVFTEIPDVRWDDVGGLDDAKRTLREAIEWPLRHRGLFEAARAAPPKGVLLSGPPGSGKTLLAKAVASQSNANFIAVKGPELLSPWVGESARKVREVFRKAKQASPCIVFIDELDALASRRDAGGAPAGGDAAVSQLLAELDGIEDMRGVVVLAATNRPGALDPALLRAGRLEQHVDLALPDCASRRRILAVHTRGMPLAPDVDLDTVADASEGMPGSALAALCRRAAFLAVRERVDAASGADGAPLAVRRAHFDHALAEAGAPNEHAAG
ncbi:MAG: CDC48 family AAA ATPase [Dehalococcoidia bacterium]|nr:CDC48 family AAA ATPase [Dehalococcoidia bacterium]